MPNLHDLLRARRAQPGEQFELDLGAEHVRSKLPPELQAFEKNFRFTPVDIDPFEGPERKKDKA